MSRSLFSRIILYGVFVIVAGGVIYRFGLHDPHWLDKQLQPDAEAFYCVSSELFFASQKQEPLPKDMSDLANWLEARLNDPTSRERERARRFCREGLYLRDVSDTTGKRHDWLILFYNRSGRTDMTRVLADTPDGDRIYSVEEAKALFGSQLIEDVKAKKKRNEAIAD